MDSLLLLRQAIAAGAAVTPTRTADATQSPDKASLSEATHLHFAASSSGGPVTAPLSTPTRFRSAGDVAVDLRSIYFAWLNREVAIPDYNAAASRLNDELAAGAATATVHKLAFVERLDLITWLEGASEDSEYIQPLAGGDGQGDAASGAAAAGGAAAASAVAAKGGAAAAVASVSARVSGRGAVVDPRLAQIYNGERRMGDRNSVLRGIKPTDFSHVRKLAAPFMSKKPQQADGAHSVANNPSLALNQKTPSSQQRRPDPIILLSPSASSLLRMSNAKAFLEGGRYVPPDHANPSAAAGGTTASSSSGPNMLQLSRSLRDIDPSRPVRFILVEGAEHFKPEYWNRVVAVFTTGQAWQFKNYRWSAPADLFRHVLGVYVGWRGEPPPESVRAYGQRVLAVAVEKWRDTGRGGAAGADAADTSRWRDREVVESIWKAIEAHMRTKGWKRDAAPTSI